MGTIMNPQDYDGKEVLDRFMSVMDEYLYEGRGDLAGEVVNAYAKLKAVRAQLSVQLLKAEVERSNVVQSLLELMRAAQTNMKAREISIPPDLNLAISKALKYLGQ